MVVLAQEEARALKHNYNGTEHILLGLVRENEGVAARILIDCDANPTKLRAAVIALAGSDEPRAKRDSSLRATDPAIEQGRFDEAAALRDQERQLHDQARTRRRARIDAIVELCRRLGIPRPHDDR